MPRSSGDKQDSLNSSLPSGGSKWSVKEMTSWRAADLQQEAESNCLGKRQEPSLIKLSLELQERLEMAGDALPLWCWSCCKQSLKREVGRRDGHDSWHRFIFINWRCMSVVLHFTGMSKEVMDAS